MKNSFYINILKFVCCISLFFYLFVTYNSFSYQKDTVTSSYVRYENEKVCAKKYIANIQERTKNISLLVNSNSLDKFSLVDLLKFKQHEYVVDANCTKLGDLDKKLNTIIIENSDTNNYELLISVIDETISNIYK